jgi:transposase
MQAAMRNKTWRVTLTDTERASLLELIATGRAPARKLAHARILLKAEESPPGPGWGDCAIAEAFEVSLPTIGRVRKRFVMEGLDAALNHRAPKAHRPRRLDGDQEAHLIALACSAPPEGRARWTLQLLADKMVELRYVDCVSDQTVRRTLKKTIFSRGARSNGASRRKRAPSLSGTWRMFSTSTAAAPIRTLR